VGWQWWCAWRCGWEGEDGGGNRAVRDVGRARGTGTEGVGVGGVGFGIGGGGVGVGEGEGRKVRFLEG